MYAVYFMFFQVASATATRYGLSRGLLGLKYDQIKYSDSDSDSVHRSPGSCLGPGRMFFSQQVS